MPRMRRFRGLLVLFVGLGCGRETFDLLPPDEQVSDDDGMAGDGPVGSGGSGYGGSAGSGFPTGGRGGREEPPLPIPDCPDEVDCKPCRGNYDCEIWTLCDTFRDYCAPYCDENTGCFEEAVPVCDGFRRVCVECTIDTHCPGTLECIRGKCEPGTPPECFSNSQCLNASEPVCVDYTCRPCFSDPQCGPGMQCSPMGRCEPEPGP